MLGRKITEKRNELGLSQEQLAEKIGVSRSAVAKWESGKGTPDIENLKILSKEFGISIDVLLENNIEDKKTEIQTDDYNNYSETASYKRVQKYIGKKCSVEMTDWNDGIYDAYIINQDEQYVYYVKYSKKEKIVGMLGKKYIDEITITEKKESTNVDLSEFKNIDINYFIGKNIDIFLNEKHIWDGFIGRDTEIFNGKIIKVNEQEVIVEIDNKFAEVTININDITKIEGINKL